MCGNSFYIQIQNKGMFTWLTLDCERISHSRSENPLERMVISVLWIFEYFAVLNREVSICLVVSQPLQ